MGQRWYTGATRAQWLALAAALLGWMFDGFEMGIFPLVSQPALVEVLGLTDEARLAKAEANTEAEKQARDQAKANVDRQTGLWNGRIIASFLVGAALGGWVFGWLGDRLGRLRAMALSVLTYASFTGFCGLARSAEQLAGLRFLSALGMGGEWSLGVALVMEVWAPHARPVLAGLIGAVGNLGYILTGLLVDAVQRMGATMDSGGWRWVLGLCVFPAVLTFFLRIFVPESEKWLHAVSTGPRPGLASIFTPDLRRRSLMAALLGGIALIGTWGSVQWIPTWVKTDAPNLTPHYAQDMASRAQMCSGFGAVLGTLAAGILGHRLSRRYGYALLCLSSLAICALLFRTFDLKEGVSVWFFVVVALTGALTASFYGWLPLYLPELFPTRVRATGQGFGFNFGRILAAFGALSTGTLINQTFHGSYAQAGATISLVYVLGLLVVWFAPETKGQPLPE
jgi:SHS family sialic acid transporter-like MFS transporter